MTYITLEACHGLLEFSSWICWSFRSGHQEPSCTSMSMRWYRDNSRLKRNYSAINRDPNRLDPGQICFKKRISGGTVWLGHLNEILNSSWLVHLAAFVCDRWLSSSMRNRLLVCSPANALWILWWVSCLELFLRRTSRRADQAEDDAWVYGTAR